MLACCIKTNELRDKSPCAKMLWGLVALRFDMPMHSMWPLCLVPVAHIPYEQYLALLS